MRRPTPAKLKLLQAQLLSWFAENQRQFPWRKARASTYRLVVSEVLLQRTRAEAVAAFLPEFITRYPSWRALSNARDDDLRRYLQPLGLWRRRAASLKSLAKAMVASNGRLPPNRAGIEDLPGVGQYISNAVLLLTRGLSEPLLDVNMARVIERCFGPRKLVDIRYDPDIQAVARLLVSGADTKKLNWALLDLAALVCTRSLPRCHECPLKSGCDYAVGNRAA
jgi:A/G-specific adenine glycosylase